jgi:hypothetical protein
MYIYDSLDLFIDQIKDKITLKENLNISDIQIEYDGIEAYPGSQKIKHKHK